MGRRRCARGCSRSRWLTARKISQATTVSKLKDRTSSTTIPLASSAERQGGARPVGSKTAGALGAVVRSLARDGGILLQQIAYVEHLNGHEYHDRYRRREDRSRRSKQGSDGDDAEQDDAGRNENKVPLHERQHQVPFHLVDADIGDDRPNRGLPAIGGGDQDRRDGCDDRAYVRHELPYAGDEPERNRRRNADDPQRAGRQRADEKHLDKLPDQPESQRIGYRADPIEDVGMNFQREELHK